MVALHTYSPTRTVDSKQFDYASSGTWRGQPQLWVGTAENVTADGNVSESGAYAPLGWASTNDGSFSLQDGRGTSGYPFGGSLPFATECHANPEVFPGQLCHDSPVNYSKAPIFAAAAAQLRSAF